MSKNTKKIVFGCLTFCIMCASMTGCFFDKKETYKENNDIKNNQISGEEVVNNDEFIKYETDGTRVNVSSNIANATKKMGELEFRNIRLSEIVNMTKITADVYNMSSEKIMEKDFYIRLLDKNGNVITDISATLGTIAPGASTTLNAQSTLDFANAYDIEFIEKVVE